jgi:hypothetical protein
MLPIIDPAKISMRKCCERYTLENATIQANMKHISLIYLLGEISARHRNKAKALVECPEGKLRPLSILIPSTK